VLSFSSPDQVRNLIHLQALSDRFGLVVQPLVLLLGFFLSLLSLIYEFHANFFALVNLFYILAAVFLMLWSYRKLDQPRQKKQVVPSSGASGQHGLLRRGFPSAQAPPH